MTDRKDIWTDEAAEAALETLFAEARAAAPTPSEALLLRVMADAQAETARREADAARRRAADRPRARHPAMAAIVAALGGWRAVAGLATAGVAGLAIGLGAPGMISGLAAREGYDLSAEAALSDDALDNLVPSFYDLAMEG
ncbi:hypothetical protein [Celeribacter indicus]|uniref:Dihydroorotate dehydrogenase n=1 Tax=Celeribacter indicus TaxID=1208324 RepID=A0A0B5E6W6_9RHOB|nr:hypothetical protein [Celeribacter indicus]AJE48062.1 hypothetical protein P73_3347 [Celeribacter indicus]SDW31557.1 hypothetical protein SAMN05443573_102343 [Celeribacter indicus]